MAMPLEIQKAILEEAQKMFPDSLDKQEGFGNGARYMFSRVEDVINRMFKKEPK